MPDISIMLVDDHEVVRTGLRSFLESQEGFCVVGEAGTGEDAMKLYPERCPDVIVMDLTMPGIGGLEATRRMVKLYPDCRILVLTVHTDQQYFFEVMGAGAYGYVTKKSAADDLVEAIRSVAKGEVYLQPVLARWLLDDYRRLVKQYVPENHQVETNAPFVSDLDVLSKRECEVLKGVAEGKSNIQIGEALGISPRTVARHRERIMKRLQIHSTTELVKFAIRTELIKIR